MDAWLKTKNTQTGADNNPDIENETPLPQKRKRRQIKFCDTWLNMVEFKAWLVKSNDEMAFCKICNQPLHPHKTVLISHYQSEKHKINMVRIKSNKKIEMYQTTSKEKNVRNAELKLCGMLCTNNVPFLLMDIMVPLIKNIFPDSQIAAAMSLKRTKATAMVNESLGKHLLNDLYSKLSAPGSFFSLIMDETTDISTKSQCAFSVIYFDDSSGEVVTRFFDLLEISSGTADDLYNALKTAILSKNIPFSNLVGFASDTPNVMVGQYHSVFSLLKQDNGNIVCVKCSCHMIHLAASRACLKLPRSTEDLLRNIGSHFNRSSQRIGRFREFQFFFKTDLHKIISPAATRSLSVKQCVDRVLEQFEPLKDYLQEYVLEDPSKTTDHMLCAMNNSFTKNYLEFLSYSLGLLTDFNLLFQTEKPLLHKVKPEIEGLLKILCSNYMDMKYIKKTNILTLDFKNPQWFVALEKIYLGVQATTSLQLLKDDLNVKKTDVDFFLKTILEFYICLIENIKQRFIFDDPIYDILNIVNPSNAQSFEQKSLLFIIQRFPVLEHVIDNQQTLDNEWRQHALLNYTELDLTDTDDAGVYWSKIFRLKNAAGVEIFPNLKKVISLLLTLPYSNAAVERVFSDIYNIKTDKRNNLDTNTIKHILGAKVGIQHNGGCVKFVPTKDMLNAKIWPKENR